MVIAIQYARVARSPVRSTRSSSTTTATTAITAAIVYSRTGALQDPPHGLEGEEPAHRDHDEEDQLLDGKVAGQLPPGGVPVAVGPVAAGDGGDVPQAEDQHGRDQ